MRSLLVAFKVFAILFWLFLFAIFTGFIFFGDEIITFLYGIPLIVEIEEYLGLTKDNVESFAIFLMAVMMPFTIAVFLISKRFNKRQKNEIRKTKKVITVPKPGRQQMLKNAGAKPLKVKKERKKVNIPSVKKPKSKVEEKKPVEVEIKQIKTKTIGLTGLQIK
jgi:hypothetical protein